MKIDAIRVVVCEEVSCEMVVVGIMNLNAMYCIISQNVINEERVARIIYEETS